MVIFINSVDVQYQSVSEHLPWFEHKLSCNDSQILMIFYAVDAKVNQGRTSLVNLVGKHQVEGEVLGKGLC